jgi:hypothetical protein
LRHSAVHRIPKTAASIERLAENAQIFLEALNDSVRSQQLTLFRRQIASTIEQLQLSKGLLEGRYLVQLKQIRTKRDELDKCEKEAMDIMVCGNQQLIRDIGEEVAIIVERVKSYMKDGKGKGRMCENRDDSEMSFKEVKAQDPWEIKRPERMKTVYEGCLGLEEEEDVFFEAVK